MKIKIYAVGGTIDKVYFDRKSEFEVGEPKVGEILKEANVNFFDPDKVRKNLERNWFEDI